MPWYVSSHTTINLALSVREETNLGRIKLSHCCYVDFNETKKTPWEELSVLFNVTTEGFEPSTLRAEI